MCMYNQLLPAIKMIRLASILLLLIILASSSCKEKSPASDEQEVQSKEETLLRLLTAHDTGIDFQNIIAENDTFNMVDYFYVYNGGGVALGDINNDSLLDVFFTGNMVPNRIYVNKGNLHFEDISKSAGITAHGWSTGVTMVDINGDGFLDIYVCRSGNYPSLKRKNLFYINNGNLTFTERAEEFGVADAGYSTQAAFFDYDRDGDLDLYVLNHTNEIKNPNLVRPFATNGKGLSNDKLYQNNGNSTFTDVTINAGILHEGFGLGLGVADINQDGWDDIYVSNDFLAHDYLYINQQNGTFKEMVKSYFKHLSHFSMGNDIADVNNDGLPDLMTVDMLPADNFHQKKMSGPMNYNLFENTLSQGYMPQYMRNTLQLNQGVILGNQPSFSEISQLLDIHATDWSWAPLLADFDNDGWKDLLITNGYLRDITDLDFITYTAESSRNNKPDNFSQDLKQKAREMPSIRISNFLFQNQKALKFKNVTSQWGFDQPSLSNGASYGDLDNDGDLDIVVSNINEHAFVYENQAQALTTNNFLQVLLTGDQQNLSALGAEVTVFTNGTKQLKKLTVTRGYQSSVDYKLHFGLGESKKVDSLWVMWPDGKLSRSYAHTVNQLITIDKQGAEVVPDQKLQAVPAFTESSKKYQLNFVHQDMPYDDFSRQLLLPHKHSNQGPGIAVGDINGDGLDDFFVGGSYQYSGRLFYQQKNGDFRITPLTKDKDQREEDLGVLLFDYDLDQDLDLYVVSGSNEFYPNAENYQDRLYNNDGKGNFTLDAHALPDMKFSGSCVRAADFDQDGDLDLFVGGRLLPLKYPMPANSYILVNEHGKYTNQTDKIAPALKRLGMVKDALWTDFDNDGDPDLIVVGEFMPVQFFENTNGKFINASDKTGLKHTAGWWNSINGGDFDGDGDVDYIIGNLGLNSKYKASPQEPITIYASDLDRNGAIDPIITYFLDHKEYPVHTRDDLVKQVPSLKKKFPSYVAYAGADISMVLDSEAISRSYVAKAFHMKSSYLENVGSGKFKMHALPLEAQFAPVYGILIQDFNQDGSLDVLLTGNDYSTEVITGRYDASLGILLQGDGKGNFGAVSPGESKFLVEGDSRGAATIIIAGKPVHLFAQNSDSLKAYERTGNNEKQRKILKIPEHTAKVKLVLHDGSERIHEFYYGASYLSQSTRFIALRGDEKQILLYDYKKNVVEVYPDQQK